MNLVMCTRLDVIRVPKVCRKFFSPPIVSSKIPIRNPETKDFGTFFDDKCKIG